MGKRNRESPSPSPAIKPKKPKRKVETQSQQDQDDQPPAENATPTPSHTPSHKCEPDQVLTVLRSADQATILSGLRVLAASVDDDFQAVSLFWQSGGRHADLLSLLTLGLPKVPAPELTLLFQAIESVALFLASEKPDEGPSEALNLSRSLMQDHYPHILLMLSPSNTGTQTKAALKMLAALVSCSVASAREIMLKIDFEHKHFDSLLKRRQKKGSTEALSNPILDVRTAYIHFMLAFLMVGPSGGAGLVRDFLTKKTNLSQIFYGLVQDSSQTVSLILSTLKSRIIQNPSVSKTLKMKLFSAHNIKPILALIHWKGPANSGESEVDHSEDVEHIRALTIEFLTELFASPKTGIVFQDPSCGTSGQNQNLLLFHVLQSLTNPWEKPMFARLIILALKACPDQLRPFLTTLEKLWTPRADSVTWIQIMDLIYSIFKALDFSAIWLQSSLKPEEILNVFVPDRLAKEVILPALNVDDQVVQMKAIELCALILHNIKGDIKDRLRNTLVCHQKLSSRTPKIDQLKDLLQRELDQPDNDPKFLNCIVDLLSTMASFGPIWQDIRALDLDQILLDIKPKPNAGSIVVPFMKLRCRLLRKMAHLPSKPVLEMLLKLFFDPEADQVQVYEFLMFELVHGKYPNQLELLIWLHHFPTDCLDDLLPLLAETLLKFPSSVSSAIFRSELVSAKQMRSCILKTSKLLPIYLHGREDGCLSEIPKKFKTTERPQLADYESDSIGAEVIKLILLLEKTRGWADLSAIEEFVSVFRDIKDKKRRKLCSHVISGLLYMESSVNVSETPEILRLTREMVDLQSCPKFKALCYSNFWMDMHFAMSKYIDLEPSEISYKASKDIIDSIPVDDDFKTNANNVLSNSLNPDFIAKEQGLTALAWNCFGTQFYGPKEWLTRTEYLISRGPPSIMVALKSNDYKSELLEGATKLLRSCTALAEALATLNGKEILKMFEIEPESCRPVVEVLVESCAEFDDRVQTFLKEQPKFVKADLPRNLSLIQLILDSSHPVQDGFMATISKTLKATFKGLLNGSLEEDMRHRVLKLFEDFIKVKEAQKELEALWTDTEVKPLIEVPTLKAWLLVGQTLKEPQILVDYVVTVLVTKLRQAFKESSDAHALDELKTLLDILLESCKVEGTIEKANKSEADLGQKLIKILLKHGLKVSTNGSVKAKCLEILSKVVSEVLKDDSEGLTLLYSMVTGHSNFMGIVLNDKDPHSEAKFWLFQILFLLEELHPGLMSSKDVPLLLASYQGTLSKPDQAIFRLLHHLECKGAINLAEFKPILWGRPARSRYLGRSDQKSVTNLIQRPKMSEILAHIDAAKMVNSAIHFNTDLPFQPSDVVEDTCSTQNYDPRFFLQIVCQICAPGEFMDRHLKIVECGALALIFAAMSSKDILFRQVSYVALSRLHHQLELSKLKAEKQIWIHLINLVRNGVRQSKSPNLTTLRVPSITATFLVKVSIVLHNPMDPMYGSITKFLLAKPTLNLFNIPEFHRLFHSDFTLLPHDRPWILSVIRDGLKNELDYHVAEKDYLIKILMCYYSSNWPQESMAQSKPVIRQILLQMMKIPEAAFDLVKNRQIIPWVTCEILKALNHPQEAKDLMNIAIQAHTTINKTMNEDLKSSSIWWKLFRTELECMREQGSNLVLIMGSSIEAKLSSFSGSKTRLSIWTSIVPFSNEIRRNSSLGGYELCSSRGSSSFHYHQTWSNARLQCRSQSVTTFDNKCNFS